MTSCDISFIIARHQRDSLTRQPKPTREQLAAKVSRIAVVRDFDVVKKMSKYLVQRLLQGRWILRLLQSPATPISFLVPV